MLVYLISECVWYATVEMGGGKERKKRRKRKEKEQRERKEGEGGQEGQMVQKSRCSSTRMVTKVHIFTTIE